MNEPLCCEQIFVFCALSVQSGIALLADQNLNADHNFQD
jgi:hypothetical protein